MSKKRTKAQKKHASTHRPTQAKKVTPTTPLIQSETKKQTQVSTIKKKDSSNEKSAAESILGYSVSLLYQDFLKTIVISIVLFVILFGIAWLDIPFPSL